MWFPNRSDTDRAVHGQKMARGWKFRSWKVEELYYPCSETKGADQLRSYCEADLRLLFYICGLLVFSCGGSNVFNIRRMRSEILDSNYPIPGRQSKYAYV